MADDKSTDRMEIVSVGGNTPVDNNDQTQFSVVKESAPVVTHGADANPSEVPPASEDNNDTEKGKDGDNATKPEGKKDSQKAEESGKKNDEGAKGEESDDNVDPNDPKGVQKRINKAVKRQRDAERERDEIKQKYDDLSARLDKLEKGNASSGDTDEKPAAKTDADTLTAPVKPKQDDFDDFDDYLTALDDYHEKMTDYKVAKAIADNNRQSEAERAEAETQSLYNQKVGEAKKQFPDIEETIELIPANDGVFAAIQKAEHFGEVVNYLGNNPEEADRIAALSPIDAYTEIVKIDTRFTSSPSPAANADGPKPKKTPSGAPPPIQPVKGESSTVVDPEKMTQKEFEAWRKKGGGG